MAAPIVYKSTDSGAPTLNGTKGTLITVLKACLVNGYGAKAGAGWTIALEDAANYKIIFRNDSTTGTGRYFRIQDNGRVSARTDNSYFTSDRNCNATLVGMQSYTDIDSPAIPFPRVIAGGDLEVNDIYSYGVLIRKSGTTTNPTYSRPWMIIADNRTCHLITYSKDDASTTTLSTGVDYNNAINNQRNVTSFGDIRLYNPSNTTTASAYIWTAQSIGSLDVITVGNYSGTVQTFGPGPGTGSFGIGGYVFLDRSSETSSHAVHGEARILYSSPGTCSDKTAEGNFEHYPSPATGGFSTIPITLYEDLNDTIRTVRIAQNSQRYALGYIPGMFACPHTTSVLTSYRVGDELSTITDGSKSYLIHSFFQYTDGGLIFANSWDARLYAFDLGDWWV